MQRPFQFKHSRPESRSIQSGCDCWIEACHTLEETFSQELDDTGKVACRIARPCRSKIDDPAQALLRRIIEDMMYPQIAVNECRFVV